MEKTKAKGSPPYEGARGLNGLAQLPSPPSDPVPAPSLTLPTDQAPRGSTMPRAGGHGDIPPPPRPVFHYGRPHYGTGRSDRFAPERRPGLMSPVRHPTTPMMTSQDPAPIAPAWPARAHRRGVTPLCAQGDGCRG